MGEGKSGRRSKRVRVHLSVSYGRADEFVREYAENLCAGGLFLGGTGAFEPLEEVQVEITLPGYGAFRVVAQVVHVITPEVAAKLGHRPGAGLQIKKAPEGFDDALHGYLHWLGRRADSRVLATDSEVGGALGAAGYRTSPAPEPAGLAAAVAHADEPVVGVVVRPAELDDYTSAAVAAGDPDLVMACDGLDGLGQVLAALDDRL